MDERNRAAAPAGLAEGPGGTFQWGTDRPAIGKEELAEAQATLTKYKSGKANLETRVVEDELWWELRHWEVIGRDKRRPGEARPTSAWLFNTLINKHADAMDNYPAPVVLPREQSDEESARILSAVLPVILEENEHEKVYSAGGRSSSTARRPTACSGTRARRTGWGTSASAASTCSSSSGSRG